MKNTDILEIAKVLAEKLNIKIESDLLILENMKSKKTPTVSIFYNKDYQLWIDRYYVAYSDNCKIGVSYVFITKHHIREELPEINKMLKKDCSFPEFIMLSNIKEQMREASRAMSLTGDGFYLFPTEHNVRGL